MTKILACALIGILGSTAASAQEPEFKWHVNVGGLTRGPAEERDPFADLSLQPNERDRLGSLGSERLDALLQQALTLGSSCAAVELLEAGADPNGLGPQRGSPLICAAGARTDDLVRLLLHYGADPNAVPQHGKTALMRAANSGRSATVRVLLEAGANIACWDPQGKTALDYAFAGNHVECVALLRGSQ